MPTIDAIRIADEMLSALDRVKQIEPFSSRLPRLDLPRAYGIAAEMFSYRLARGEKKVGRKIGFTNRGMWQQYGVYAPVWGYMYDTTVFDLSKVRDVEVARFSEPKIEPEIAFKFARAPSPGMDEAEILGCVEWVAHAFEIVQSPFPNWQFAVADTVVANAFHGAFFFDACLPVAGREDLLKELSAFEISLIRGDELVERAHASAVLDGPLSALRHFIDLLASDSDNPPVSAGEIVTTGTVTKPYAITAGEVWRTEVHGLDLPGLEIRFC